MKKSEIRAQNMNKAIRVMKKCMLKYGVVATTKDMVAKKSGLSMASIVRYFRTKDNMLLVIAAEMEKTYKDIYKDVAAMLNDDKATGADILRAFFKTTIRAYEEKTDYFALEVEVMYYLLRREGDTREQLIERLNNMFLCNLIANILRRGVEDGTLFIDWHYHNEVLFIMNSITGALTNLTPLSTLYDDDPATVRACNLARMFTCLEENYTKPTDKRLEKTLTFYVDKDYYEL